MAAADLDNALFLAAKGGRDDDLQDLITRPYNVNVSIADVLGNTPLHYAAGGNHPEAVRVLLSSDSVNVNAVNHLGETPLHKAAQRAGPEVVKLLLAKGADTLVQTSEGLRAFDYARNPEVKDLVVPVSNADDDDEDEDDEEQDDGDSDDEGFGDDD